MICHVGSWRVQVPSQSSEKVGASGIRMDSVDGLRDFCSFATLYIVAIEVHMGGRPVQAP